MSLYEVLMEYQSKNYYPMHMPGHKRNSSLTSMENPYGVDITEIEGFDNLHDANSIIQDAMKRAAEVYGSEDTHFLVNGSTVGILASIAACTQKGDQILVARNCHKAVYNAIFLNELNPIYIYPQIEPNFGINGGISVEDVKEMLIIHPDIKLIIITSPTYEGILSNIREIADVAHSIGIPLLVDEAHGAHLGFHSYFPQNSIEMGADVVIHSVHKTMPAFTQTALIHMNGNLVKKEKVKEYLSIYQTSSPSYILMAGIDLCMELVEKRGTELFLAYANELKMFYQQMEKLQTLRLLTKDTIVLDRNRILDIDPSKVVISCKNTDMTGDELYHILLDKYKIQVEMVSTDYVIAMTSIGDKTEGFERLRDAIVEIDEQVHAIATNQERFTKNIILDIEFSPYEAYNSKGEWILQGNAEGKVSKEYAYLYPPGIPFIVPGERITKECLELFKYYKEHNLSIKGLDKTGYIQVVSR